MSNTAPWLLKLALTTVLMATTTPLLAQTLFTQSFTDPTAAASQFMVTGSVYYSAGAMTLSPGGTAVLAQNIPIADTGGTPITYSVRQSFAPGSLVYPQYAQAQFRVRALGDSLYDGYYIVTALTSRDPYIGINRITDAERQFGRISSGLIGGSMYAPPALSTLGPYVIDVSLSNTPDAVTISVSVNGVVALVARDTSEYRITQGDSFGLICDGTHAATWDDLKVMVVPEPSAGGLFLLGSLVCGVSFRARWRRVNACGQFRMAEHPSE